MPAEERFPTGCRASGALYAKRSVRGILPSHWAKSEEIRTLFQSRLPAGANPKHLDRIEEANSGRSGWRELRYFTREPFDPEDIPQQAPESAVAYQFLVREVNDRFLLVGTRRGIAERLLERLGQRWLVRQPTVATQAIAKHYLLERQDTYVLSTLWTKVNGFGNSIKFASFYGDDLAGAPLVNDLLHVLAVTRVQLRDLVNDTDILSVSHRGELSFYYSSPASLRAVDDCLAALTRAGFLSWGSPSTE